MGCPATVHTKRLRPSDKGMSIALFIVTMAFLIWTLSKKNKKVQYPLFIITVFFAAAFFCHGARLFVASRIGIFRQEAGTGNQQTTEQSSDYVLELGQSKTTINWDYKGNRMVTRGPRPLDKSIPIMHLDGGIHVGG